MEWDALIMHQFTGTREGMTDLTYASQNGAEAIPLIQAALDTQELWPVSNSWALAVDNAMIIAGLDCTTPESDPQVCIKLLLKQCEEMAQYNALESQKNEANELLCHLGLDPELYRTDGGFLNHFKIAAAIKSPADYPYMDVQPTNAEAEQVCAQAYQVVGSLLSDLGKFNTQEAEKILDNLSQAKMVHTDVLPWKSYVLAIPPECTTENEKKAFAFGYYKGIEYARSTLPDAAEE